MKNIEEYINTRILEHTKIMLRESRGIFDGCRDIAIFVNSKIRNAWIKNESTIKLTKQQIEDSIKQEIFFSSLTININNHNNIVFAKYKTNDVILKDGKLENITISIGLKNKPENIVNLLVHELTHAYNDYKLLLNGVSSIYDLVTKINYNQVINFNDHSVSRIIREMRKSLYILLPFERNSFIAQLVDNIKQLKEDNKIQSNEKLTSEQILQYIKQTDIYNAYKDISILIQLYKQGELSNDDLHDIENEWESIYNERKTAHKIIKKLEVLFNQAMNKIEIILPKHMIDECLEVWIK